MGRPPCCQPSHESAGITAVAIIVVAAFAYAKIGPAVAAIVHTITVVLTVLLLTAVTALAAILVTWTAVRILGKYRRERQQAIVRLVPSADQQVVDQPGSDPRCLACGGTGTVLRAIATTGSFQDQCCPACQPDSQAG